SELDHETRLGTLETDMVEAQSEIDQAQADITVLQTGGSAGANITVINLANAESISIHGDSYTANSFGIVGKGWAQKVAEASDWRIEAAFSQSGYIYQKLFEDLINNTSFHGSLGFFDINPRFSILISYTNDMTWVDRLDDYINDLRTMVEGVLSSGSIPILATEYHDNQGRAVITAIHRVAEEYGVPVFDTLFDSHVLRHSGTLNDNAADYAPFWGNVTHPGVRTNEIFSGPLSYLVNQLPRPKRGLKFFRMRTGIDSSDLDNLRPGTIEQRRKVWKEIYTGHKALDNPQYFDALDLDDDVSELNSEYMDMQNGNRISFSEYSLAEMILPRFGPSVANAKLKPSTNKAVDIYLLDRTAAPTNDTGENNFYPGFYVAADPGVTVGDVYEDTDNKQYTVAEVFQDNSRSIASGEYVLRMEAQFSFSQKFASGTLTKISGEAGSPVSITYTNRVYSFTQYWHDNYGLPQGHWTQLTASNINEESKGTFNGVDQSVDLATQSFAGDFFVEMNLYPNTYTGNTCWIGDSGNPNNFIRRSNLDTRINIKIGGNDQHLDIDRAIEAGKTVRFRLERVGTTVSVTLDGVLQSNTLTAAETFTFNRIGGRNAVNFFDGAISDVNINGAITYPGGVNASDWEDTTGSVDGTIVNGPLSSLVLGWTADFSLPDGFDRLLSGDKLAVLIHSAGGFTMSDLELSYEGGEDKHEFGIDIRDIDFPKPKGAEILSETLLDAAALANWTNSGGTAIATGSLADGVSPQDTLGVTELDTDDFIEQALTLTESTRGTRKVLVEIWARRFPPIYDPANGWPGSSPFTEDSYDEGEILVDLTYDMSEPIRFIKYPGLHYVALRIETEIPAFTTAGTLRITSKSDDIQIAKVSMKTMD
ncbi:MAG: hypothetical protein AAFX93_19040, partial [Verrucomicrobiota bacterium]